MRSLDLFSGIGGITHALRGLGIEPAMYVEIEKNAQAVLRARMVTGDLPTAPIHNDVKTLTADHVRDNIDIILAGSPCTGFSTAGKLEGLNHPGSSLFREVIRLATLFHPPYLFFENVAAIRTGGLNQVSSAIHDIGYHCWWVTMPAYIVGAPQHRRRWYCLCVRDGAPMKTLVADHVWSLFDWSSPEPPQRMLVDKTLLTDSRKRASLLGYSIVPDIVRLAFLLCWTGLRGPVPDILSSGKWTLTFPLTTSRTKAVPTVGGALLAGDTEIMNVSIPKGIAPENPAPSSQIVLVPDAYISHKEKNPNQTARPLTKPTILRAWASPRGTMMQASGVLTVRSQRDLPTQLRFEQDTPNAIRSGFPNPTWIEWLMGFPTGWTKVN
jgi:hypothetical protein